MPIEILNIRLGFATNSSSSHSIVLIGDEYYSEFRGAAAMPRLCPRWCPSDEGLGWVSEEIGKYEFGWDTFTLASPESKKKYLAVTIAHNLDGLPEPIVRTTLANVVGDEIAGEIPVPRSGRYYDPDAGRAYIDHQSILVLPRQFGATQHLDLEFAEAFRDFLLNERVAILGGHDNGDGSHPLYLHTSGVFKGLPKEDISNEWVCRRDPVNGIWTLFSMRTGTKIRFRLDPESESYDPSDVYELSKNPVRPSVPELVDMKITDFCDLGCDYCYMGSTENGEHADMWIVRSYLEVLAELKVFEVSLGGGEPTSHPEFDRVLSDARGCGIVPNFTTRTLRWGKDKNILSAVREFAGGFALTVRSAEEVRRLAKFRDEILSPSTTSVNVHLVMGTLTQKRYESILQACAETDIRPTLLGFKSTGRGQDFTPTPYPWALSRWLQLRATNQAPHLVAFDTLMIQQFEDELKKYYAKPSSYEVDDGFSSCYIDAVSGMIGPTSYHPEKMIDPGEHYGLPPSRVADIFRGFSATTREGLE